MMDCIARIPYSSVIGFTIILIGSVVSTVTSFELFKQFQQIFRENFFQIDNEIWLAKVCSLAFILFGVCFAFFILLFAIFTIRATFNKIYQKEKCRCGGRPMAVFILAVTYLNIVLWICATCIACYVLFCVFIFNRICANTPPTHSLASATPLREFINLNNYGIFAKHQKSVISDPKKFQSFCKKAERSFPLIGCFAAGVFMNLIGQIICMASMVAYHVKLRLTKEISYYRQILELRNQEGNMTLLAKQNYPANQNAPQNCW